MEKDFSEKLSNLGLKKKSQDEIEREIFGGKLMREVLGLTKKDPITTAMVRKIFAMGKVLGLSGKDEIKAHYDILSISDLTVGEGMDIINQMEEDANGPRFGQRIEKPVASSFNPETLEKKYKNAVWTKKAGVHMIDGTIARCGACSYFEDNKCSIGKLVGVVKADSIAPITKNCFSFRYGELTEQAPTLIDDEEKPF
jgi:hypothetical protein